MQQRHQLTSLTVTKKSSLHLDYERLHLDENLLIYSRLLEAVAGRSPGPGIFQGRLNHVKVKTTLESHYVIKLQDLRLTK